MVRWSWQRPGFKSQVLGRASPTVVNTEYNSIQMWDGRKATLEEQTIGPMVADVEMNADLGAVFKYGFYGNVNPQVPHPRWTQAREVRIGELKKRETLPFNGYAEQVARLYHGLDPRKHY